MSSQLSADIESTIHLRMRDIVFLANASFLLSDV